MKGVRFIFPDTCLLMNFAAVGRIDIVEQAVAGRAEWTETISDEVGFYAGQTPFQMLAQVPAFMPQAIVPDSQEMLLADGIRRAFAQPGDGPRKHLGEAETFAVIDQRFDLTATLLLTEDKAVVQECRRRGLATAGSRAVLELAAARQTMTWADADALAQNIIAAGRPVLGYPPPIRQPMPQALLPTSVSAPTVS
ncbi:hypothetical protein [Pseudarthrobacter scleromae]|uniref:hypothetical protein n=1 Tax=Pseudarthrobacter scleromae TaxID=158897 RepID=UPI003D02EE32